MKLRKFLLLWMGVLAIGLVACSAPASATIGTSVTAPSSTPSALCRGNFTATVYRGPDTGLSVQGELTLQADASGSVTGVLKHTKGLQVVSIVGQANGRAINLLFDLGKKQLLFGVGTMQNNLRACEGQAGGPLVGPREADSGDWGVIWGS